jgi:endonuclease/exonuclease/phosphatase family metal-dependent hydrolase
MVTWVRFRDTRTGREFYFFNTHFDNAIQLARDKSAVLVRQRVEALKTGLPVLLGGDFNCGAGEEAAYATLTGDKFFTDTWLVAKQRRGDGLGTFNNFKEVPKYGERIDWILARGRISVSATEIVTFSHGGRFPSDHFPVVAWLRFD